MTDIPPQPDPPWCPKCSDHVDAVVIGDEGGWWCSSCREWVSDEDLVGIDEISGPDAKVSTWEEPTDG